MYLRSLLVPLLGTASSIHKNRSVQRRIGEIFLKGLVVAKFCNFTAGTTTVKSQPKSLSNPFQHFTGISRRFCTIDDKAYPAMSGPKEDWTKPDDLTVQAAHITEVHDVPISVLIRPLVPEVNEVKVKSLMETIKVGLSFIFWLGG